MAQHGFGGGHARRAAASTARLPLAISLIAASLLAGCGGPAPSSIASPSATASATTGLASPAPSATEAALRPTEVEIQLLPDAFTSNTPLSLGTELVWSMGGGNASPDLWRFVPERGGDPELVFESPLRDSVVGNVARSGAGYAFAERNDRAYGDGGWRVWFLPTGSATPVEIDRGNAVGARGIPTLDLDDRRLAWAGFDEPESGPRSFLRVVELAAPTLATALIDAPIEEALIWHPILEGDTLWYATILADFDYSGEGDEFHIETRDLGRPTEPSTRFEGTANDFNLALSDAFIAWKTAAPGFAALNWGDIWVQPRDGGEAVRMDVQSANEPSLGNRFMTFREISSSRLLVYDLVRSELVDLTATLPEGYTRVGAQTIAENLLVFYVLGEDDDDPPRIAWTLLPD